MRRHLVILAAVLSLAAVAVAGGDVLRLRSGRLVPGKIVGIDDSGVTLKTDAGAARYDWASLTPLCQYEIRAERLDPSDAEGHVALAEFCLKNGLYPYARREVNTARGLGHPDSKRLDALARATDQAEADEAFARIDQLMAEEEYDKALDEVSRFIRQAPKSRYTDRAHGLAREILKRRDSLVLREAEERKVASRQARDNALSRRIGRYLSQAEEAKKSAAKSYAGGVKNHVLGKVSRAEKAYLAAEKAYLKAVQSLGRVQRLSRRGVTFEKAEGDRDAIRKKLVDVYLGLARLKIEHRNYKGGSPYVNKALYLDPVNKEALDLRKEIDENRIHRSARRLTNTPAVRTE